MKIKWTNKYSGEVGFVKSLNEDKTDFINTTEETEAEEFSADVTREIISSLKTYQEQNEYIAVKTETDKAEKKTTKPAAKKPTKAKPGRPSTKTK